MDEEESQVSVVPRSSLAVEQEEETTPQSVDELQAHGIGAADIAKLRAAGICTVRGVGMASRRALLQVRGLSEAKVDKLKEVSARLFDSGFASALELSARRASVFRVHTGSAELDRLLGGGVESMAITEAFGEFRTGKTQLSMTLVVAVQAQIPGARAAYIDTEGTFRPERLRDIANRFQLDPEAALDAVLCARAYNTEHQAELVAQIAARMAERPGEFRVLVVDSVISLFRTDYSGRGELGERQQRLNQLLARLTRLAEEFNVAVFITNQMMSDPGAGMTFVPDPKKPVGGHVLAHASTTRLALRKGRNETRIAKVYDSPDLPEAEATYAVGPGGIVDASE